MDGSGPLWLYLPRIYLQWCFWCYCRIKKKQSKTVPIFCTNLAIRETPSNKYTNYYRSILVLAVAIFEYISILHWVPADFLWGQKHSFAPTALSQWGQPAPTAQRWHRPWFRHSFCTKKTWNEVMEPPGHQRSMTSYDSKMNVRIFDP